MSDEWEAIRNLDDKENWIERTSVLSKDDHQHLLQCAEVTSTIHMRHMRHVCLCIRAWYKERTFHDNFHLSPGNPK